MVEKIILEADRSVNTEFFHRFRQNHPERGIKSNRVFRIELTEELVKPLLHLRASIHNPLGPYTRGRRPSENLDRLKGKHFPYKASSQKRCVVCYSKGSKRKDIKVSSYCPKCNQHMCIGTCFEKIPHTCELQALANICKYTQYFFMLVFSVFLLLLPV